MLGSRVMIADGEIWKIVPRNKTFLLESKVKVKLRVKSELVVVPLVI